MRFRVPVYLEVEGRSKAAAEKAAAEALGLLLGRVHRMGQLIQIKDTPQALVDREGELIVKASFALLGLGLPEAG